MPSRPQTRQQINRPLATPRLTAATTGVSRKMGEVLNHAGADWEPRLLANLYAAAALQADDAHGTDRDLVTQHHHITRADLAAVLRLAAAGATALDGEHGSTGNLHPGCARCDAVFAFGRVRNALNWTSASPAGG